MKKRTNSEREIRHIFQAIALVTLFLLLCISAFSKIDLIVYDYLSQNSSKTIYLIMQAVTLLGSVYLIVGISLIVVFLFVRKNKKVEAITHSIIVLSSAILVYMLKLLIGRERPLDSLLTDYSFPSGHTLMSLACYGSLAYILYPKTRKARAFLFIPLVVAASRVYLGLHWLSDVVAGVFLGVMWLLMCITIINDKIKK